ncbi:MAG: nucleotide exchange factor GrpE [Actinomycetota bacterium]|nr:nucleotide exchange factor GrpE [Actinomycetota bacterium]
MKGRKPPPWPRCQLLLPVAAVLFLAFGVRPALGDPPREKDGSAEARSSGATVAEESNVNDEAAGQGPDSRVTLPAALAAGILIFGVGMATGWVLKRTNKMDNRPEIAASPPPPSPPPALPSAASLATGCEPESTLISQRRTLVDACIEVRDLVPSASLRSRLGRALAAAGVSEIDPSGTRFDANLHRAVETLETDDASLDDVVASVVRRGYRDDGRILRPPDVSVYRLRRP